MPHIEIAYFDRPLSADQRLKLNNQITQVIQDCLDVPKDAVSIALEPIASNNWVTEVVFLRMIARIAALLREPGYDLPETSILEDI